MINQSRPTTSISNSTQPNKGETWASITTRWNTETRTWLQSSKLITNEFNPQFQFLLTEASDYITTEDTKLLLLLSSSLITNQSRP